MRGSTLGLNPNITRRLLSIGSLAALFGPWSLLAGCDAARDRAAARLDGTPPVRALGGATHDDWSTFAHDAFRSGFQPQRTPVTKGAIARLRLRWRYETGDGLQASPLVADGRVYVASQRGIVRALDAREGKLLWATPTHATIAMTPALAEGKLFVGDHAAPGDLIALDAASGNVLWRTSFAGGVRSEPIVANGTVYEGETGGDAPRCNQGGVQALDARTGNERWVWYVDPRPSEGGSVWSPLSYDGTHLIFGTGNTCEADVATADAIVALDTRGRLAWSVGTAKSRSDNDVGGGTLLLHDQALVTSKNALLYDVDRATGTLNWTTDLGGAPGYGGIGTPSSDGSTIVASAGFTGPQSSNASGGLLAGLDRSGRIRWTVRTGWPVFGSVAIANGIAFTPLDDRFVALDLGTGAKLWSYPAGQRSYASPAVVPSGVYFANGGGQVFAFSLPEQHS